MPSIMSDYDNWTDNDLINKLTQVVGEPQSVSDHDDYSSRVTDYTKPMIQQWIKRQGIAGDRVSAMRAGTLANAYLKPAYLHSILTRGDYNKDAQKLPQPREPQNDGLTTQPLPQPQWNAPQPAVSNGHDPASQLAALIAQIAGNAVNEARVIELVRQYSKPEERVVEKIVLMSDSESRELPPSLRHECFAEALTIVSQNIPLMLVGGAGSGKTTIAHQIAEALELPFSHTGAIGSRYELSGFIDAHGQYQRTAFRDAYENGGTFLFDEYDASDPNATLWCNTAIANGVCAFPDGNVSRHANFRLIAACNTYGKGADRIYVGRNQQDGAQLDRFVTLDFDYDEKLERAVFGDNEWTAYVQKVRAAIAQLKLRHVVSPRATDYGKRLLAAGLTRDQVEKACLWKGLDRDQIGKIKAAL